MSRNISVGIDVGTYAVRVVVSEFGKGDLGPRILGIGGNESKGLRHGYIANIEEATKSIIKAVSEAERNSGVKIRKAIISVSGISLCSELSYGSTVITRADGEVTYLDVNKAFNESEKKLQIINKRVIHIIPISYKLDGKEIMSRPESMKGIKLEVKTLFINSLEQHLEDLITSVTNANIEVLDVIADPLAASLISLSDKQKIAGCVLVDIGGETVSIAIFENGNIIALHVFSIGSTDITNDIALGFKVPLEEAEAIKMGNDLNNYSKKKMEQIIEARLKDIFELIDNYLKKIKRSELLPAGVIIIGGGANTKFVEEISRSILKLPTKILTPDMFGGLKNKVKNSSWFTALGLCIAGKDSAGDVSYNSIRRFFFGLKNFIKNIGRQLMP